MRNFKRFLSIVLVATMLMTSVSCLGSVFASAEDAVFTDVYGTEFTKVGPIGGTAQDHAANKADYDALYGTGSTGTDGWIYLAADVYEVPAADIANYDVLANATLTDGYVQPGDYVFTALTIDLSDGYYLYTPSFVLPFTNNFFESVDTGTPLVGARLSASATGNTDMATYAARMNPDNGMVGGTTLINGAQGNVGFYVGGYTVEDNMYSSSNVTAYRNQTKLKDAALGSLGVVKLTTAKDTGAKFVFKPDSSTWFMGYLLKVKAGLSNGTVGAIWCPKYIYKSKTAYGLSATDYYNGQECNASAPGNIQINYVSNVNTGKNQNQVGATLITEDFGAILTIGTAPTTPGGDDDDPDGPSSDPNAVEPGEFTDVYGTTYATGPIGSTAQDHAANKADYDALYGTGSTGTDGWIYLAADCYEVPAADIANYDVLANATLTDGYVMPGDYIFTALTIDLSDGYYLYTPSFVLPFSNNFFESVDTGTPLVGARLSASATGNTDMATYAARMNPENGMVGGTTLINGAQGNVGFYVGGYTVEDNMYSSSNVTAYRNQTKLTNAALGSLGVVKLTTAKDTGAKFVFKPDSSTWFMGYLLKVKSDVELGDTGAIWCPKYLYKCNTAYGLPATDNYNGQECNASAPGNIQINFASNVNTGKNQNQVGATFITEDFGASFICGKPGTPGGPDEPIDDPDAVEPGDFTDVYGTTYTTGPIGSTAQDHAANKADYDALYGTGSTGTDGWIYLAADCYEVPAADIANYDVLANATLTDGYVMPGDYIFTALTIDLSDGYYLYTPSFVLPFSNDFFESVDTGTPLVGARLSASATGNTDMATYAARMNPENGMVGGTTLINGAQGNVGFYVGGYTVEDNMLSSSNVTAYRNQTKLTDAALGSLGVVKLTTAKDTGAKFVFKPDSSTWFMGYLLKVKSDVELGDTGAIWCPKYLYKCKTAYGLPATDYYNGQECNASAPGNIQINYVSNVNTGKNQNQVGATLITEDFGASFICGKPGTPSSGPKAKFYVGDELVSTVTSGTVNAPADPEAAAGKQFLGWATEPDGLPVDFPYTITADTNFYAVFMTDNYWAVFYESDGSTELGRSNGVYGAAITAPSPAPTKEGYTLSGWATTPNSTTPATLGTFTESVNYYAIWTTNTHKITWYDSDGTTVLSTTNSVRYGSAITPYAATATGKTLAGWAATKGGAVLSSLGTMPDNDVAFYAVWTNKSYTITWKDDAGTYTDSYEYGAAITARTPAEKTGYTCNGWNATVPGTMPANALTFTATYTANEYEVRFYNADYTVFDNFYADYDSVITAPATNPTRTGYNFTGWSPEVDKVNNIYGMDFYPTWAPKTYTVTYVKDGETYTTASVAYDSDFNAPTAPSKAGFNFGGWALTEDGTPVTWPYTLTTEGLTLYAIWNEGEASYTLEVYTMGTDGEYEKTTSTVSAQTGAAIDLSDYEVPTGFALGTASVLTGTVASDNSTVIKVYLDRNTYTLTIVDAAGSTDESVYYGAVIVPPTAAHKTGYEFTSWANVPETMPAEAVTITAQYELGTYDVTFDNDGTVTTVPTQFNGTVAKPEDPEKTGYDFVGWAVDGTVVTEWPYTLTTEGAAFVAVFDAIEYTISIYDGMDENGGFIVDAPTGKIGDKISEPTRPVWADGGMKFNGWVDENNNTVTFPITVGASDMKVYATWAPNNFYIDFYAADGSYITGGNYAYESKISDIAPDPGTAPAGKSFAGWYEANSDFTAPDLTKPAPATVEAKAYVAYMAYFTDAMYTIYFSDGETTTPYTGVAGSEITAPEVVCPIGYDFDGWYDANGNALPETLTVDGVTYTPIFAPHVYKVNYYVDNELVHSDDVAYGDDIPTAYNYTKEGYTVSAWDVTPSGTMDAADINVYATTTKNSYKVTWIIEGSPIENLVPYGDAITAPSASKEGYDFIGWDNVVPATMPAEELTFTAQFSINSYDVVYLVDGEEVHVDTVVFGQAAPAAYVYTKTGYTVSDWDTEVPTSMPAHNVTINATTTINTYKLILDVDGDITEISYEFGAAVQKPADPIKEGFEFTGWNAEVPTTMPAENVTLVATFSANTYTITWVIDGEETDVDYEFDAEITVPEAAKTGYTFKGWDIGTVPAKMPADDLTITAVFEVNYYDSVFVVDGTTVKTSNTAYGELPELPATPSKAGYTFAGWEPAVVAQVDETVTYNATWTEADGVAYTVNTYTMDTDGNYGDAVASTLYARTGAAVDADAEALTAGLYYDTEHEGYVAEGTVAADGSLVLTVYIAREKYDLTFSVDGKDTTTETYYGAAITAPEATKTGYTFVNWTPAVPATMPAADSTYTANFAINTYEITWKYGDNKTLVERYQYGAAVTAPANTDKTGYTFSKWDNLPATMPADNITVTAEYTVNQYTITYMVNGEEYTVQTYNYGADVIAPDAPVVEGNTFSKWNPALPATMPASSLIVNAVFGVNDYTFTYIVDGVAKANNYAFGATIPAIRTPSKLGYTFAGWVDGNDEPVEWPATMPAEDLTITATWTVNNYTLTYVVDGVETSVVYEYGATIEAFELSEKEGYTFAGWTPAVPTTMPAENTKVTANWTVNSYNATFTIDGADTVVPTNYGEVPAAPEAAKEGYTFDGWFVTGDDTEAIVDTLPAIGVDGAAYTAKFSINTYNAIFDANGGQIDGVETVTVPTVYGETIEVPADPVREGYNFEGWQPVPATMPAEETTYVAQWSQDMDYCRIKDVQRITDGYYETGFANYTVRVEGNPIKIQFCPDGNTVASWTFDRNVARVTDNGTGSGVIDIVESTDYPGCEIWTIRGTLPAQDYKVRAKLDYDNSQWEAVATAYDFTNTLDEAPVAVDMIKSVSVDKNVVVRGEYAVFTVVTDPAVTLVQFYDAAGDNTVAFSKTLSSVSVVEGTDSTTWTINMRMTYLNATELYQDQTFTYKYRCDGDMDWSDSDKDATTIRVTKYDDSAAVQSEEYDAYSVVEATAVAGKKLTYTPITVVTTKDVTKVRFTIGTKTATYTASSANVTTETNGDLTTWTIGYRFLTAGDYTVNVESRGNEWTGDITPVEVKIFATQAEADEYNASVQ